MVRRFFSLTAVSATLVAVLFTSCITDEKFIVSGGDPDNDYATLSFDPRFKSHETRAEWWGDDLLDPFPAGNEADSEIATFRVLVYDHATGALVTPSTGTSWNFFFQVTPQIQPPFKIRIPASATVYDFVFIANEHTPGAVGGTSVFGASGSSTAAFDQIADLDALTLDYGDDIAGGQGKPIPMVAVAKNVVVSGPQSVKVNGVAQDMTSGWGVDMLRAAIRLSIKLVMDKGKYEEWKTFHSDDPAPYITIDRLRTKNYLMPGIANVSLGANMERRVSVFEDVLPPTVDASLVDAVAVGEYGIVKENSEGRMEVRVDRLIYTELTGTVSSPLKMSMGFAGGTGVETKSVEIYRTLEDADADGEYDDPVATGDYTMPRNTWLLVEADVENDMNTIVRVLPWDNAGLSDVTGNNYRLTVEPDLLLFDSSGGGKTTEVFTDHPDNWRVDLSGTPEWLTSVLPASGVAGVTTDLEITVAANPGGAIRKGKFNIVAGNLTKSVTVVQLPNEGSLPEDSDIPPANVTMYVGAFWKAQQYGERLIRIARPTTGSVNALDGDWAAIVVEGKEWIVLDNETTKDRNVGWRTDVTPDETLVSNGNDTGFDVRYRVNSTETMVAGVMSENEPQIYFRIGLNSVHTPTQEVPARYGLVMLMYTNGGSLKFQKIYIRQGEDPDYLMRPEDPATGLTRRDKAMKFSPYNLTAAEFRKGTASQTQSPLVNSGGGALTNYPTQAGAFFQWDYFVRNKIHAFNPAAPALANPENWDYRRHTLSLWNTYDGVYESCPEGYRRPSEGIGSDEYEHSERFIVPVEEAEFAQSLFTVPFGGEMEMVDVHDNSMWGFYADGYFDRHLRADQTVYSTSSNTDKFAVSVDSYNVAYGGRLFYNPHNGASLFFPAAGQRMSSLSEDIDGNIINVGVGTYLTSTLYDCYTNYSYKFGRDEIGRSAHLTGGGQSIRCVVDVAPLEGTSAPFSLAFEPAATGGIGGNILFGQGVPGATITVTWPSGEVSTHTVGTGFSAGFEHYPEDWFTAEPTVSPFPDWGDVIFVTQTEPGKAQSEAVTYLVENPWGGPF